MRTIEECIADIGFMGSTIFTSLDLKDGFYQMPLEKASRPMTSFTVPPLGQFMFTRSSMGLKSSPAQLQRMMELSMKGLNNVIVYFDDLLIHSKSHAEHRIHLQEVFTRLQETNLKLKVVKCHFGCTNVDYLGFRLTPNGILPGSDKLKCVREALPPRNVHEIRQFLGLANFFRSHVRNFASISSPLNKLTRKEVNWRGGELPPDALQAFQELRLALISEPVVAYPRNDRPYALIVDSATGNEKKDGGVGAILCQADDKGNFNVISYASRALSKHEKNYSAFLIELTGCAWGIEHFSSYLKGRKFTLFTDHRPLEKLSTVHKKTLSRLEHAMTEYDFIIQYHKGADMPSDYLSRNVLASIDVFSEDIPMLQHNDEFARSVFQFLQDGSLPADGHKAAYIKEIGPTCFTEHGQLWRRLQRHGMPTKTVLVIPRSLVPQLVEEAHGQILTGHDGISKTKERLLGSYFWPNMDADISAHITSCVKCQARRKTGTMPHPLTPLTQCTAMNQRVHIDLFGPLKTTSTGKKYIFVATDAFSKYAELAAIDDKTAPNVARVLFDRWVCRFGTPLEITSDNGLEFCNQISKELFKLLQIKHTHTSPYHPQTNAAAEIINKTIAKYLSSMVDETTMDWPMYVAPMQFAYNTSINASTGATPFFITFGQEARLPSMPSPDIQRLVGESAPKTWFNQLQEARNMAVHNNLAATEKAKTYFDSKIQSVTFKVGQLVWLNEQNFLGRNRKLSPNFTGPHTIIQIFGGNVIELNVRNRRMRVNSCRVKPYHPPSQLHKRLIELESHSDFVGDAVNPPPFLPGTQPNAPMPQQQQAIPPLPVFIPQQPAAPRPPPLINWGGGEPPNTHPPVNDNQIARGGRTIS